MPYSSLHRLGVFGFLAGALLMLPACSRSGQDPVGGCTITGKVTYNGKPVAYGFVVFYDLKEGLDQKTGEVTPAAVGKIENGSYTAEHVLPGNMMICVATDPDADTFKLIGPRKLGEDLDPRTLGPGGAPGKKDGGDKAGGDPKDKPPPPPKKDTMPAPVGAPASVDPVLMSMTQDQKLILKEIHAKYGRLGTSPLQLEVKESDRAFDLILTK